jgi:putative FmdB family regulatory protein
MTERGNMPRYDYLCHNCNTEYEIEHSIKEPPKKICKECGAPQLERLISRTSFSLVGTGWYSTDYKNK